MKVQRLLFGFIAAACAPLAFAQAGAAPAAGFDPSKLDEQQIKHVELPQALVPLATFYERNGDLQRLEWTMQRFAQVYPQSGDIKLKLAAVYAQEGKKSEAYSVLLRLQQQGFGYDLADDKQFAKVSDTEVWTYVTANLQANLKPFGEGKVAFELPKGDYLFESIAWDPKRQKFLVASAREGKIYLAGKDGKLEEFIAPSAENGLWSAFAIGVDAAHDALYVANNGSFFYKGFKQDDFGKAGISKFKLSNGKFVEKFMLPSDGRPHTLSSMAVGKDGQVFVADGIRNEIYRLDSSGLKSVVANPRLTSVRGLAVSDDGKQLYFADYDLGVFGIDLATGKGFDLAYNPLALALGGVDGLYYYDGTLVAIESGMSPRRVIRMKLAGDGHTIAKMVPLEAGNPLFTLPTYGTIAGNELYFIANSQKGAYGKFGTPEDESKLQPVRVFKSDLRFAWNENGINTAPKVPGAAPTEPPKLNYTPAKGRVSGNMVEKNPAPKQDEPKKDETKKVDAKKDDAKKDDGKND